MLKLERFEKVLIVMTKKKRKEQRFFIQKIFPNPFQHLRWHFIIPGGLLALVAILLFSYSNFKSKPVETLEVGPTVGYGPVRNASNPGSIKTSPKATLSVTSQSIKPTVLSSDHYGLIVTGLEKEKDKTVSLNRVLELSEANWWYQYTPDIPKINNRTSQQVFLIRTSGEGVKGPNFQHWMQYIHTIGHFASPTYWLIGNEPNVEGQDNTPPDKYAELLHEAAQQLRIADPQATLIGPNVLNWNYTCQGCPGYTSGLEWAEKMRQAYRAAYNAEPPFDVWSIHTYSLDWEQLPLVNQTQDADQLEAFRRYLNLSEATKNKTIWLTEFGVIWGYDNLSWEKDAAGKWLARPAGTFRTDLLEQYLVNSLNWLEANADRLNIKRWFLFTSYGEAESYADNFTGIALFDSSSPKAQLTNFGRIYIERLKKGRTIP
jgi:hypothetical protein